VPTLVGTSTTPGAERDELVEVPALERLLALGAAVLAPACKNRPSAAVRCSVINDLHVKC